MCHCFDALQVRGSHVVTLLASGKVRRRQPSACKYLSADDRLQATSMQVPRSLIGVRLKHLQASWSQPAAKMPCEWSPGKVLLPCYRGQ